MIKKKSSPNFKKESTMRKIQFLKKLFFFAALGSMLAMNANEVSPTLVLRSQGKHADRQKMVGMTNHTHLTDQDSWYGTFDITVAYARSFREDRIARCLFGTDLFCGGGCPPTIKVQGSNAENSGVIEERDPKAWLADYLYLNCDFVGEFSIKPRIQNVTVDLDLYVALEDWASGLYFRLYGPITWTKWETNFCSTSETDITGSCQFGGEGYFTSDGSVEFLSKLSDYFIGKSPEATADVTFQPLKYAKMPNCDNTQAGFADLRAELGYDFWQEEDYHLGVNIQAAAPTGNRRRAEFVLDPVVGNGNSWELGGGVTGHYVFWRGEDEDKSFSFHFNADVTHLFQSRQQRTFDLQGKPNSRYMLAACMTKDHGPLQGVNNAGNGVEPQQEEFAAIVDFGNVYAPVANLTTLNVQVDIGVQADIVAMFNWQRGGFNFDLGYNFWGRSCEDIKCPLICNPCDESVCALNGKNKWVLKGDARMYGYLANSTNFESLSPSQSNADIHSGTNATFLDENGECTGSVRLQNCGVDNAKFAVANGARLLHSPNLADNNANQVKTSIQPIFITCDDIDLQQTRGISHTVFGHMSYTWDREDWIPFIGVGGSGEFGKAKSCCDDQEDCCVDDCKNCLDWALSQWTVWLKAGVQYN